MSKQELTQILNQTNTPITFQERNWIIRYNMVIDSYNKIDKKRQKLHKLECSSSLYQLISKVINSSALNIILILALSFAPILNLAILAIIIAYMLFVKTQTQTHNKNLEIVADPFAGFYFYPQMCAQIDKHFSILNLTVDEIQNFKFSDSHQELRQDLLKSGQHNIEDKLITVPIYDQYFYDSFFLVKKQFYKSLSWVLLGILLIGVSVIFYSTLFGWI